jgi:hypothetical protein
MARMRLEFKKKVCVDCFAVDFASTVLALFGKPNWASSSFGGMRPARIELVGADNHSFDALCLM